MSLPPQFYRSFQHTLSAQTTSVILMIRPARFDLNEETLPSNAFQQQERTSDKQTINNKATIEFTNLVAKLKTAGIEVIVIQDTIEPHTPDSIFPNNWVSFHEDGTVFLYPMQAKNRRLERRTDILTDLVYKYGLYIQKSVDISYSFEPTNEFLEGTGSMVLDRVNRKAYACLSPRTNEYVLTYWCTQYNYEAISFTALDKKKKEIYHTNVVMCIGRTFAVICLAAIQHIDERAKVANSLVQTGHEIVDITFAQMNKFAGNMLQLNNKEGQDILVLSQQAYDSLTAEQITTLEKHNHQLIKGNIPTIERYGGGSVRCMIAEVFLPKKND